MKNYLMPLLDKILLRKRFIIETPLLTSSSPIWGWSIQGTGHPQTPSSHILSCLAAYSLGKNKNQNDCDLLSIIGVKYQEKGR